MWRHQSEIDALLGRIRQLVIEREQRRREGAGDRELGRRNTEIGLLHARLADRVRRELREEKHRHGMAA